MKNLTVKINALGHLLKKDNRILIYLFIGIVRAGVAFRFTKNGYEGLVKGKKVYIAVASGGIYSEGVMQPYDFAAPYLKAILGFIGITDVSIVRVEGTAIPEMKNFAMKDFALENAIERIVL